MRAVSKIGGGVLLPPGQCGACGRQNIILVRPAHVVGQVINQVIGGRLWVNSQPQSALRRAVEQGKPNIIATAAGRLRC